MNPKPMLSRSASSSLLEVVELNVVDGPGGGSDEDEEKRR